MQLPLPPLGDCIFPPFSEDFYSFFLSGTQSAFSFVVPFILHRGRNYSFDGDEVVLLDCVLSDPQAVTVGLLLVIGSHICAYMYVEREPCVA